MKTVVEQMKMIAKGVEVLVGEDSLKEKLERSVAREQPLVIKLGLDPSAPDIHLGHCVVLRKIRQMQDMGHRAVIVIGDFTGQIGDPTGKSKKRTQLSKEQVMENAKTYCEQIFKVLDQKKTEVRFNSEWLSELKFEEVLSLASITTVARMLEREEFKTRYQKQEPISMHEFFYPLMQAYDSIELEADIELGGTDQTFNILMGRTLQKAWGKEQQAAIFMPILEGLDGVQKMSKSLGNYIGVNEPAEVMFKKVMEVPDELVIRYFELATDEHPDVIAGIKEKLEEGCNPRDIKLQLAEVITGLYHDQVEVEKAKEFYDAAFRKKGIPEQIPELVIEGDKDLFVDIIPMIVEQGVVKSNSELRRMFAQGGVKINGEILKDLEQVMICGDVLKVGKKGFYKIVK